VFVLVEEFSIECRLGVCVDHHASPVHQTIFELSFIKYMVSLKLNLSLPVPLLLIVHAASKCNLLVFGH
jgi:hypothetical protein